LWGTNAGKRTGVVVTDFDPEDPVGAPDPHVDLGPGGCVALRVAKGIGNQLAGQE
jgi:hypothetical protein